jgi:mono/diheme cytochrome c family protein
MVRFVAAAALAALFASLAFAQSFDPSIGTGNIDPSVAPFVPESPAARRGLIFVQANCAQCHAVDRAGPSPLANAPPLRALRIRYAVADLQRPLAEGIHKPPFRLSAGQLADVMTYLKTLQP